MSELRPNASTDTSVPYYGAQAVGGRLEAHGVGRLDGGAVASTVLDALGATAIVTDPSGGELENNPDTAEVVGHIVGSGSDREITGDFRYQYGHAAVALSETLARAVIDEDVPGERTAREQLAIELASLRKDFAVWEAGLAEPKSDSYFEATGIISEFNLLDRPHLPVTLNHEPENSVDPHAATLLGSRKAEADSQPSPEARQRLFSWLRELSDAQLVNYFQWSEARTDAVSAALASQREVIEQNVRDVYEHLIAVGLMPEDARDAIERGFEYTTIFGALSSIESGFYQADGIYETDARRLGVHRKYSADEAETYVHIMHIVFVHESLHAYDAANDTGLTYLLSKDEEPLVWVDEAVKEHLTEAGTSGQPYVLDPADRYIEGAYRDIRELLHLVLTAGEFDIDLRDVMAANFERHSAEGPNQAREELVARLRASYQDLFPDLPPGETILHVIAKEISAAPKPLAAQVIQDWIQKVSEWRDEKLVDDWPMVG